MKVGIFECPDCGDTWHVPRIRDPRADCRKCGGPLTVDIVSV